MHLTSLSTWLIFTQILSTAGLQFMGRAISFDWHFRSQKFPPFRETLDLQPERAGDEELHMKFVAFGKHWTLDVLRNNLLCTSRSKITERSIDGRTLRRLRAPSGCYYVGTAKGGDSEYGMASVSLCGEQVNGLVVTNANDYVIYEKGWKSRRKRSTDDMDLGLRVANTSEIAELKKTYERLADTMNRTMNKQVKDRWKRSAEDVQTPKFYKLDPPSGRNLFVEFGVIVDKYYMNDFKRQVSTSETDLVHHILLSFNNAQLWYLHPSFGFALWVVIRDVVLIDDDMPLSLDINTLSNPSALCKWVRTSFKDNGSWDEVMILSSKPEIWHGRVGLAQRAGVCSHYGNDRCAGVTHVNFQLASLARLIAHEAMHPLGVGDDYEGRNSELCFSGVMRRGVWQDHDWSVCAVQGLEKWAGAKISDCVTRKATDTLSERATPPLVPVNIAWRANVVQSTTYKSEEEWGAWKATDGPVTGVPDNGDARYGSCTHTMRQDKPWIRIDLSTEQSSQVIDTIVVFNRDDCCADRLKNFQIRIGNNANFRLNSLCFHHKGGVSGGRNGAAVISCRRPLSGRYVSLQLMDLRSILTVCELQIMAKVSLKDFSYRQNECHDIDGFCPYWHEVGECTRRGQESYMQENCPYSCGVCKRPDTRPTGRHAPYDDVILPVTAKPNQTCQDSHESCLHYAVNGDCEIDIDTRRRCPWSCNLCTPTSASAPYRKPTTTRRTTTESPSTTVLTTPTTEKLKPVTKRPRFSDSKKDERVVPPEFNQITTLQSVGSTVGATSTPAELCADEGRQCSSLASRGYCRTSSVIREQCQKSCGRCPEMDLSTNKPVADAERGTTSSTTSSTTSTAAVTTSTPANTIAPSTPARSPRRTSSSSARSQSVTEVLNSSGCKDDLEPHCEKWATAGLCSRKSVSKACRKSCATCEHLLEADRVPENEEMITDQMKPSDTATVIIRRETQTILTDRLSTEPFEQTTTSSGLTSFPCADSSSACISWANAEYCAMDHVAKDCPFSCKLCNVTQAATTSSNLPCTDKTSSRNCSAWARRGYCRRQRVKDTCPKTCKEC